VRGAIVICLKDLRQRIRDRSAFIMGIVVPLSLAFIFNLLLGGAAAGTGSFVYGLVDQDHGQVAAGFDSTLASLQRQGIIKLETVASPADAARLTSSDAVHAAFVIPPGFSQAVTSGQPAQIQLIANANQTISIQVARSIADSFAASVRGTGVAVATAVAIGGVPLGPAQLAQLAAAASTTSAPVSVQDISAQRHQLDSKTYYAAGMAVLFLFFTVSFGVLGLIEEREEGTLSRLLAAPIGRRSVMVGKLASSFLFGVAAMAVLIVTTSLLMGAHWGNPVGVALLVISGVLAATGVMALVATFAKNAEDAGNLQSVVAIVLGVLGGTFFPVALVGGVLEHLSLLTPQAWFLRGLADLASGAGPGAALPAVGAIMVFAVVMGALALVRLPRAIGL